MMTNMLLFAYNYVHGTITIPVLLSLNSLLIRTRYQLKERSSLMRFDRKIMKMFKRRSNVSSVTKINGCLYDSIEVKKKGKKRKLWNYEVSFIFLSYSRRLTSPLLLPFLFHRDPVGSWVPRLLFIESRKAEKFCRESCRRNAAGSPLNPDVPGFRMTSW